MRRKNGREERRNEKEKEERREGVLNEEKLKKEANEGDGRKDGMNRRSSKDWTGIFLPSPVSSLPWFCYIFFPASSDFSYPSSSPLMISSLWLDWFFASFFFSTLFTTGFSLDSSVTIKIPHFLSLSLSHSCNIIPFLPFLPVFIFQDLSLISWCQIICYDWMCV